MTYRALPNHHKQCFSFIVTAWLLLLAASPGLAGTMAYGDVFVRAAPQVSSIDKPSADVAARMPEVDESDYLAHLEAIEGQGGPYDNALAEPLADFARALRARGEQREALALYRRAVHIVRVNEGLSSHRQLPLVQEILDLYRATGDLHALDEQYEYYFRLYGSGQPPFTEARLRATLAYLAWQREAIRFGLEADQQRRMLNLYQLNDRLLQTGAAPTVSTADYSALVLSQLSNLYLLNAHFDTTLENVGLVPSSPVFGADWDQQDFTERRIQDLQRTSLSRGRDLLQGAIDKARKQDALAYLPALYLALGDWNQWRGNDTRAAAHYQQVVSLLESQGRHEDLHRWLAEPVELPQDDSQGDSHGTSSQAAAGITLSTQYDVSTTGRVSNLRIAYADKADRGRSARLARALRQTRFRPRWVEGAAQAVTGVVREYQLVK